MLHATRPNITIAIPRPRTKRPPIAVPHAVAPPRYAESKAAPLVLAIVVASTLVSALTTALAGAL